MPVMTPSFLAGPRPGRWDRGAHKIIAFQRMDSQTRRGGISPRSPEGIKGDFSPKVPIVHEVVYPSQLARNET